VWFVVVACSNPRVVNNTEAVFVEVSSAHPDPVAAAARACAETLRDEIPDLDPDYLDRMFVTPFDPDATVTLKQEFAYERVPDEFKCCGGVDTTEDGHSGTCHMTSEFSRRVRPIE
jgi:hypothetical protein